MKSYQNKKHICSVGDCLCVESQMLELWEAKDRLLIVPCTRIFCLCEYSYSCTVVSVLLCSYVTHLATSRSMSVEFVVIWQFV